MLQKVADGKLSRVIVTEPPRHGKTELISRLFSAYFLYRYPQFWVGLNSYSAELATGISRNSRDYYVDGGGSLKEDAATMRHWETGEGGGLWAAGVGGPITGKGFHLGIIDDPLKNAKEANSHTIREAHKDWYRSTFSTREEPDGAIVIVMTRWHEDDLVGWLLREEEAVEAPDDEDGLEDVVDPERWHIVAMPAIAEESEDAPEYPSTCTVQPEFRQPGEALCPERYSRETLLRAKRRLGSYYWSALYQRRPVPPGGLIFKREWFTIVEALPTGCKFVRYWDKAGTAGGGDASAGVLFARSPEGRFFVVDAVVGRWSSGGREKVIKTTAQTDAQLYGAVTTWQEQEPGSGGKESAENTTRNLAGHVIRTERVTGDKTFRARPLAAQAEVGNVYLLKGPWNKGYLDELTSFPNGANDDQVDGSSGGFNKLAIHTGNLVDFA